MADTTTRSIPTIRIGTTTSTAPAEMIESGLRPERTATINRDFASYEEAVQYFLRATNVTDAATYFADLAQGKLPFLDEEPTQ